MRIDEFFLFLFLSQNICSKITAFFTTKLFLLLSHLLTKAKAKEFSFEDTDENVNINFLNAKSKDFSQKDVLPF